MRRLEVSCVVTGLLAVALLASSVGCEQYFWLPPLDGSNSKTTDTNGTVLSSGDTFSEILIQGRTFVNGAAVTSVMYDPRDATRRPRGIDFNADGKIDPVVSYATGSGDVGVAQILLSQGAAGTVDFLSLTFDSNGRWRDLSDIAVADFDGDGGLDLMLAARDGVAYLHSPGPGRETILRDWGSATPDAEFLAGSTSVLSNDEVEAILSDVLPPGTNLDDYDVTVEQGYTQLEVGDMDGDTNVDVVASRRLNINLSPKEGKNVPPLSILAGEIQVFINPGGAITSGENWTLVTIGRHERYDELDRSGAAGLLLFDLDGDLDLDVISAARDDDNASVSWFENPGRTRINEVDEWTPWRIGSLRDAIAIDVGDVTGDGLADVIATGGQQKQLVLFEQPSTGPTREYDWDTYPIVTFESFEPRDVKILDLDDDNVLEIVVGGNLGQLRYFEPATDPRTPWTAIKVLDFDPQGEVGWLGYGDLDADEDLDLIAVLNSTEAEAETQDRVVWVENDLR
ncbi:MAG: FG-GAP-like repeat-containing protein [Phycisphaerae bacterium]